tara:strand:+ start:1593 stop:2258 length:666 start_codon:yes stop_codon:yes gene_type:complete
MKKDKTISIPPLRYIQLIELVKFYKPSTILEVGCWNGEHGLQMCEAALSSHESSVHYIGYDLFEDGSMSLDKKELNSKSRQMHTKIADKFKELRKKYEHRFNFELIKGDTNDVMEDHSVDFAFLDGGHSIATVQNDYAKSITSKVIVFDDYFTHDHSGNIPDAPHLGTNVVVDNILDKAKWIFPSTDPVREGGITHLAVIVNEGQPPHNKDVLLVPLLMSP